MNFWKRLKRLWELSGKEEEPPYYTGGSMITTSTSPNLDWEAPESTSSPAIIVSMTDPLAEFKADDDEDTSTE